MQVQMPRCRQCVLCGNPIEGKGRIDRIYCLPSCRTLAWRLRTGKRWGGRLPPMVAAWSRHGAPAPGRPTLADLRAELEHTRSAAKAEQGRLRGELAAELERAAGREAELKKQVAALTARSEQAERGQQSANRANEQLFKENQTAVTKLGKCMQELKTAQAKASTHHKAKLSKRSQTNDLKAQLSLARRQLAEERLARQGDRARWTAQTKQPRSPAASTTSAPRPRLHAAMQRVGHATVSPSPVQAALSPPRLRHPDERVALVPESVTLALPADVRPEPRLIAREQRKPQAATPAAPTANQKRVPKKRTKKSDRTGSSWVEKGLTFVAGLGMGLIGGAMAVRAAKPKSGKA